jgi:cell division protein FtsB
MRPPTGITPHIAPLNVARTAQARRPYPRAKLPSPDFTFVHANAVINSGPMNVDLGIWGKLTRVVIVLLVIALLAIIWQWYLPLIKQNERMRRTTLSLDNKIQIEEATNKQFKASIDTLRYDTNAIERLAREKLRYAKPGETVVVFEPASTNSITAH